MNQVLSAVREFCLSRGLVPYSTKTHTGFLRNLVVRRAEASGEVMVNLVTSTHDAALMTELAGVLRAALPTCPLTLVNNVTARKSQVAVGDEEHVVDGPGVITETLDGLRFTISANSFFQTNSRQAEVLYGKVLELVAPRPDQCVYDLYCGAGAIALLLARAGARVLGIEVIESAVADAAASAEANGIGNCEFRRMDLRDLRGAVEACRAWGIPEVVVTDPPRAGMHPKAVQALRELQPRRIVYVSCKPASLARDARMLCEDGLYRLGEVHPVDMFPQTNHIEAVAVLELVTASDA
jgi:23S rRNA (uracil1939-C5)-methyltransferase